MDLEESLSQLEGKLGDDNNGGKDGAVLLLVVAVDLLQGTKLLEALVDGLMPSSRLQSFTFIRKRDDLALHFHVIGFSPVAIVGQNHLTWRNQSFQSKTEDTDIGPPTTHEGPFTQQLSPV